MADRYNANLPEILRCQPRQYFPIDLIVAEGRYIPPKAQTLHPRRHVHAVILGSAETQLPCSRISLSSSAYQRQRGN